MTTKRPETYFCQNASCGHAVKTREMQYGEKCPVCGRATMDDFPPDAEVPTNDLKDEQSLDYFNRYVAGDR